MRNAESLESSQLVAMPDRQTFRKGDVERLAKTKARMAASHIVALIILAQLCGFAESGGWSSS